MRMRNPFSGDPGDEASGGNGSASDPLEPPEKAKGEAPAREPEQAPGEPEAPTEADAGGEESPEADEGSEPKQKKGPPKREHHLLHEGEFTAPSIGPHTVIERPPPEERLDFDKISDTDAMGQKKRREVVGKTYGPTKARVFGTFAAFFAIVAALAVGFYFLAQELDQPPAENPDVAPWSQADAPQSPPKPLQ